LGVIYEDAAAELRLIAYASQCGVCIFGRLAPSQKSSIAESAKNILKYNILAVGDGNNDTPMIQRADLGIRIIPRYKMTKEREADFVIENFRELDNLIFKYGFSSYVKISKMICYYFYKNMILVFAEIWFSMYCGYSGQIYFLKILISMYNAFLTNVQVFIALYYEKTSQYKGDLSEIEAKFYYEGITSQHFNMKVFWGWVLSSILHGSGIFFLSIYLFKESEEGILPGMWCQSTIAFSMILHSVSYKLILSLNFVHRKTYFFTVICIIAYYVVLVGINLHFVPVEKEFNGMVFFLMF